jgi:hypothetical protein
VNQRDPRVQRLLIAFLHALQQFCDLHRQSAIIQHHPRGVRPAHRRFASFLVGGLGRLHPQLKIFPIALVFQSDGAGGIRKTRHFQGGVK